MRSWKPDYIIDDNGCWIWQKQKTQDGYGRIFVNGKYEPAHRYWYKKHRGRIPAGLTLDHLCMNKLCCNPDHMSPCDIIENNRRRKPTILAIAYADWKKRHDQAAKTT